MCVLFVCSLLKFTVCEKNKCVIEETRRTQKQTVNHIWIAPLCPGVLSKKSSKFAENWTETSVSSSAVIKLLLYVERRENSLRKPGEVLDRKLRVQAVLSGAHTKYFYKLSVCTFLMILCPNYEETKAQRHLII